MANFYPALKAHMGNWTYYIIKMRMRELGKEVQFASEINEDKTLDEAIQRSLNESRVKNEIVAFLARREDRFFSSVVVATLGGSPQFYPVKITDDVKFQVFSDQGLDDSFGVLSFNGDQKYYALDGQHRLKAIKSLTDKTDPTSQQAAEGFDNEEISVLLVVRKEEADAAFLTTYRRLFSSLNRYAKATDKDTNIIMDEDDAFAILTRRLITEHEFFKWPGFQKESARVQTKGKNLNTTDPFFTSLQTLYAMNQQLLTTTRRRDLGWGIGEDHELTRKVVEFKTFRPEEPYLDDLYEELILYWEGLLHNISDLREDPPKMRIHDLEEPFENNSENTTDHLLFWPIGQELLASVARRLLTKNLKDPNNPDNEGVNNSLASLSKIDWRLHQSPWKYFLLTYDSVKCRWRMRNEDRKEVLLIAERILAWLIGIDDLTNDDIEDLKLDWQTRLTPAQETGIQDEMWETIQSKRSEIIA